MTTEQKKAIGIFLGFEVIQYKGQDTFNKHSSCRTIGELKEYLGIDFDLEYTGRFVKDINYPYETDYNYLMILVRKILALNVDNDCKCRVNFYLGGSKISNLFEAVIDFIEWYNSDEDEN
jgi:hypothetical protein